MDRKKLKGGSLSGTYHCIDGGTSFIRKEVSLLENREFGFYRWSSQLKKIQRLGKIFPDIFPKVVSIGVNGDSAYFDMEFIQNAVTVYHFLRTNPSQGEIKILFKKLVETMDALHSVKIKSFKGGFDLYINQEVTQALHFCMDEPAFQEFTQHKIIVFNGEEIFPLFPHLAKFYELANRHYTNPEECLTHGNITLENILYIPAMQKIVFIDLYEENFIDTIYNEYSQLLQSCSSYYEVYNELSATICENIVTLNIERCAGLDYFNRLFTDFLYERLSEDEIIVTKLYEVSQFTRMLPFKKHIAKDKIVFFYSLASYLFHSLTHSINSDRVLSRV